MFSSSIEESRISTVVELSFSTGKKTISERKVFLNPIEAKTYVSSHLYQYITFKLRNFILHSWKVGISSRQPNYSSTQRTNAMEFALDFLRWMKHKNLHEIAYWIRANISTLKILLPAMTNHSYPSSKRTLDELFHLATQLKATS
jgi:hypothetical protein